MVKSRFHNLDAERVRKGLTNENMAAILGISYSVYMKKLQSGKFSYHQMRKLAKMFDCGLDYLFEEGSDQNEHGIQDDDSGGA